MNLLIAEPKPFGHRLNHVGMLLAAARALPGVRVTLAFSSRVEPSRGFREWVGPRLVGDGAPVSIVATLPDPVETHRPAWIRASTRAIADAAVACGADHVLVPGGDGVVQFAAAGRWTGGFPRRRGCKFEGMFLRGKFAYGRGPTTLRGRAERAAWIAAARVSPFERLFHMDPVVYEAAIAARPSLAGKLRRIPDPVDPIEADLTPAEARAKLGLPVEGRMFGCAGAMRLRKGIGLLVRSFSRLVSAGRLRENDRLLLAGEPDDETAAVLDGEAGALVRAGRIVAVRRFLDDAAMSNAISAMDLMVTAYPRHVGSASFALRSAAQRRPVLADRFGWCGLMVPRFGLGAVVDVLDDAAFDAAIVDALDRGDAIVDPTRRDALVRYNASANFTAHWMARVRERLGLPPEPTVAFDGAAGLGI